MTRVSVVGTVHEEDGLASVSELLPILERIQPEVIFLECPPEVFDQYLRNPRKLESVAAKRYRESHNVVLIPVDLATPEVDFFRRHRALHDRLWRSSSEYGQLVYRDGECVRAYGFAYLNSELYIERCAKRHEVTLTAINKLADATLDENYALWTSTNKDRDRAMMENIRRHCSQASIKRAVLLVGAAHRQSMMNLARLEADGDSSGVQWDFTGFLVE